MCRLQALITVLLLLGAAPAARSQVPTSSPAIVVGTVTDADEGTPVVGARIRVGDVEITTGADGVIPTTPIVLGDDVAEVDVDVSAAGYLTWHFGGLVLRAGRQTELHVKLQRGEAPVAPLPQGISPAQPRSAVVGPAPEYIEIGRLPVGSTVQACYDHELLMRIPVERLRFDDYVRSVLPNEWIASWPDAALDAGAIAVKQYAWYNAFVQPKWRNRGYSFDLLNTTCDQVYKPDSAHPRTDAAIARTWSTVLTREGRMFPTYYRSTDAYCGALPDCMGQWGSYDRAMEGMNGVDILLLYYAPAVAEDYFAPPDDPCSSEATALTDAPASSLPEFDGEFRIYLPLVAQCGGK